MKKLKNINRQEQSDADNPEWSDEMFKSATLGKSAAARNLGGRPKSKNPKQSITIRLSSEVLEHFKSEGKGWQTRIDNALKKYVTKKT